MTKISDIFNKQRELMEKYELIEEENGFRQPATIPVDLNHNHDQHRLKDFAWRVTEEMTEALEQFCDGNWNAGREELADVLHFLSEMTILAGMDLIVENEIHHIFKFKRMKTEMDFFHQYGKMTYELSMAMHELKNKPWKQSHRETDKLMFTNYFLNVWEQFLYFCYGAGMNLEMLFDEYMKKHLVNKQRQKSGY